MKPHYDFTKAGRSKFCRKNAHLRLPIYLDGKLQKRLARIAEKSGRDLGDVFGDMLVRDVELLEKLA
jgi:cytidylate kinase